MPELRPGRGGTGAACVLLAALAFIGAALIPSNARAADGARSFRPHGNCVEGSWTVPFGVTEIRVTAGGADGGNGRAWPSYDNDGNLQYTNPGGKGGYGAYVDATVPVSPGTKLYVGVASSSGTNLLPGGKDGAGSSTTGAGGAASWVSKGPRDPQLGSGGCAVPQSDLLVVAGGGGGGAGAGSLQGANGGAGGSEATGGSGADGGGGASSRGRGGGFGSSSGGAGGIGGSLVGCTSGSPGGSGRAFSGGAGGGRGYFDPLNSYTDVYVGLVGASDCSTSGGPLGNNYSFLGQRVGGDGGGGGGGYWGGGGGGGSANSGNSGAGGGAAGKSFGRDATSMTVGRWGSEPSVTISPVLSPPVFSSDDHATFTVGSNGFFAATATGANTPYVSLVPNAGGISRLPDGLRSETARFSNGDGAGAMNISGTPVRGGVNPMTIRACNLHSCIEQPFTLTINEAPSFSSNSSAVFQAGQFGSVTVTTTGWPRPSFSSSGKPGWLTVTDLGNGTATLSGTPPVSGSPNSYSFNLTASNGIGSPATQTMTIPIVTALTVTPASTRLVPGMVTPTLSAYRRGFEQQFRAIGTRPDGGTVDVTNGVRWSSSDPGKVEVNGSTGFGRGVGLGTSTITAATATPSLSSQSFVTVAVPSSITIQPGSITMARGQTRQFTALGCYGDPCSLNSFNITDHVTWSELPHFAIVDENGLVTASSVGGASFVSADIRSSAAPGSVHAEVRVEVTHGKVTSLSLSPARQTVPTRGLATFQATARYEDGFVDSNTIVSWSAQNPTGVEVARVPEPTGSSSHIEGFEAGTATVRASYANTGGPTVTATATLNVISIPSGITVTAEDPLQSTTPLLKGKTRRYKATAFYDDGTTPDKDVTQGVTWTSGDPSVVTVSQDGVVKAVGTQDQSVPIFASYRYENVVGGTSTINSPGKLVTITVMPPPSISITPTTVATLHPFDSVQFSATATYIDGSQLDVTRLVNWQSDATGIGTVSGGLLSIRGGTTHGTLRVSAYKGNVTSNSVTVVVTDPLDHVTIGTTPGLFQSPIQAGSVTGGFFVNGYDARGNYLEDVTYKSTFSITGDGSCNSAARTCGGNIAGAYTVTATTPDAVHPDSTNSVTLTVVPTRVDSIELVDGSTMIYANQATAAYHVTGYDRFGNSKDVTTPSSFGITPDGLCGPRSTPVVLARATCTAPTAGSHTVTASYDNGLRVLQTSAPLEVQSSLVLGQMVLSGGSSKVAVGGKSAPFTVTTTDAYGNPGEAGGLILEITPDGTCDITRLTCTPTSLGVHTVKAKNVNGLESNTVTFTAVLPDHIQLHATSDSVPFNLPTQPYSVEAFDSGGTSVGDVTDVSTLSISPEGSCDNALHRCTAADTGPHTVTATYSGGTNPTDTVDLQVVGADHIQIVWDHAPEHRVGDPIGPLAVEAMDESGHGLGDVTDLSTLSISPDGSCDPAVRTCTPSHPGPHTVTATYSDGGTELTDSFDVDVDPSPVIDHIVVTGGTDTLVAGQTTPAFEVHGVDAFGNDNGDLTQYSSIGIDPSEEGASCDEATHTCTATRADSLGEHHTIEFHVAGGFSASVDLTVIPAAITHLAVSGGNDSVGANHPTDPYLVHGLDAYGNDAGDVTADSTLSIAPEGTCDNDPSDDDPSSPTAHTCTAFVPDFFNSPTDNTRHTVTASYNDATGSATVFVNPNDPPFAPGPPAAFGGDVHSAETGMQYQTNQGTFQLVWGRAQDPNHDTVTYTLQRKSAAPGSDWETLDSRIPDDVPNVYYDFGGVHPREPEGTWLYRVIAGDGGQETEGPESLRPIIVDRTPPSTSDDASSSCIQAPIVITLSATDDAVAVEKTYYEIGSNPPDPTTSSSSFDFGGPQAFSLQDGEKIKYFSVDTAGNAESVNTSAATCRDIDPPTTTDDVSLDWQSSAQPVTLTATDDHDHPVVTYYEEGTSPDWPTTDSPVYDPSDKPVLADGEWIKYFSVDEAGNVETTKFSEPAKVDTEAPTTFTDVPYGEHFDSMEVTLFPADNFPSSGVCSTYYVVVPAGVTYDVSNFDADKQGYDDSNKPVLLWEETIYYQSTDCAGNVQDIQSAPIRNDQIITFDSAAPTDARVGDHYAVAATSTYGLAVTFTADGACSVSGSDVTMNTTGTCNVTAHQDGDGFTNPAPPETQSFSVGQSAPPTNFQATGGVRSIVATWSPPSTDGGFAILEYRLTVTPAGGTTVTKTVNRSVCSGSPAVCSFTVTGLANATSYDLTVAARTSSGTGASANASATTFAVPSAPQNFSATPGDGQAGLSWNTSASDGGSAITAYRLRLVVNGIVQSSTNIDPGTCTGGGCVYTLTGLANGTRYALRLTAVNAVGESPIANAVVTPAALAGAPTGFQATGGVRSIGLTWGPPVSTGGPPISMYTVTATPTGGTAITKSVSPSVCSGTPVICYYTLTALANGTAYALTVAARTSAGTGSTATASASTIGFPSAPQNFAAAPADGQAGLTWNAPASDGGAAIIYRLRVLLNGVVEGTTDLDSAGTCDGGACAYTLTGLRNGTRYVLRLTAVNALVESAVASAQVTPAGPAPAPENFQATGGVRNIALTWFPLDNAGGLPVSGYVVTATPAGGTAVTKAVSLTACIGAPIVCSFTLTGLPNSTSYSLTVAARTLVGTGPTATASASTFALPSVPRSLAATPGDGQAALSWTPSASDGGTSITAYRLRVVVSGVTQSTTDLDPAGASYTLTGLTNGTRYGLRLTAVNAAGESPVASVQVTPHA